MLEKFSKKNIVKFFSLWAGGLAPPHPPPGLGPWTRMLLEWKRCFWTFKKYIYISFIHFFFHLKMFGNVCLINLMVGSFWGGGVCRSLSSAEPQCVIDDALSIRVINQSGPCTAAHFFFVRKIRNSSICAYTWICIPEYIVITLTGSSERIFIPMSYSGLL